MVLLTVDPDFDGLGDEWNEGEAFPEQDSLALVLADVLDDSYAEATPDELDEALDSMLEEMSAAEAFGFAKALGQIQRGAARAVSDPAFAQIASRVLPTAGGALGTVIGGPLGTAAGTRLGTAASSALTRPAATPRSIAAIPPTASSAIAGGSTAAARGLILSQHPDVLKALLGVAMGQHGQQSVSGVPAASVMSMLSQVFGQAAEDADELMWLQQDGWSDSSEGEQGETPDPTIYTALLDADNQELAEAWESAP